MKNPPQTVQGQQKEVISVSCFLNQINTSLSINKERVQGEVTSVNKNYPKAVYFTIKDKTKDALLNCIIFRYIYNSNSIDLKVGDEIIIEGIPEIYAPRGTLSFKTQTIEYSGEGALKKAYEKIKRQLLEEGLFELDRKRTLPKYPEKIGVITSKAGVVIQDFSSNLGRYGFKITMTDSRVDGKDAIHDILASLKTLKGEDIEVLVIMRGGGSWESLQPFNTESVVRAIANFKCPVLTGIGHDTDVTLSEMVADVGVSTPTAVAEILNESWDMLHNSFKQIQINIFGIFQRSFLDISKQILSDKSMKIRSLFIRLERKILRTRNALQSTIGIMKSSIYGKRRYIDNMSARVFLSQKGLMNNAEEYIMSIEKHIKIVDPERNLSLGYSLSYANNRLIRSTKDVSIGDIIKTQLLDGNFTSKLKDVE